MRCEECGFDWDCDPEAVIASLRSLPRKFAAPLTRFLDGEDARDVLTARPAPTVWSAIEYAAHMPDALDFYDDRIARVLAGDLQLPGMDPDAVAIEKSYATQDPVDVHARITARAEHLADRLAALDRDAWQRAGIGVDGAVRTVLVLARRAAHEGQHHLLDIGRGLRSVRGR